MLSSGDGRVGGVGGSRPRLLDGTPFFGSLGKVAYDPDEDLVQCHLCGRWLRFVGGTHLRWHGWTLERYRIAFQLRNSMPTCARGVSGRLRRSAERRIGERGFANPPADSAGSVRSTPPWRSLARLHPEIAAELHPTRNGDIKPSEVAAGSKRKLSWLCAICAHEWQSTVANRVRQHAGCPRCGTKRRANTQSRVPPERSLAVNRPDLMREVHPARNAGLDLLSVATYSTRRLWWMCSRCGYEWQTTPANRSQGGTGCPACWKTRRGVIARTVPYGRSVAARHPELVAELDPELSPNVDPSQLGARSDRKLWWLCSTCSHKWLARVADRSAGTGCPACGHRALARP